MLKLLHFSATWCGPCRMMKPVVDRFVEDNAVDLEYKHIDIDNDIAYAKVYNVQSVPTFILMKDEKEVDRIVGATNRKRLDEMLTK